MDEPILGDLIGIIVGHTYFYLADIVPKLKEFNNKQIIVTP